MENERLDEIEEVVDNTLDMEDSNVVETDIKEATESFDDVDIVDELTEDSCERFKLGKAGRAFFAIMALISAILTCCAVYMQFFMWSPKERDFCDDNIFCGNSISISEQELDGIISSLENELGIEIPEEYEDEYSLLNAVIENECLTDSEKQVFYGFIDLIKDNPYIDKEAAYRSLRNVDVSYKCRPYYYDETIQGVYSHSYENIGIFEKDDDNLILVHEGIHCIFSNEKTANLPEYFIEGMTELLSNEYFEKQPFVELESYPLQIAAVEMLCEVTSPDVVLEAFSCGNMDIIAQEMTKITRDIEESRGALDMLEKTFLKYSGELSENLSYEELFNGFVPIFRGIIAAKHKEIVDRNPYYYNEILFGNIIYDDSYNKYIDDLLEFGRFDRAYFSSKLKNELASKAKVENTSNESQKTYTKE